MTANIGGGRTGIDANPGLASIHTFDASAGCDSNTFQPCSDKALSNLLIYEQAFRSVYSINSGKASTAAVATGRYPEDSYYNGNVSSYQNAVSTFSYALSLALVPYHTCCRRTALRRPHRLECPRISECHLRLTAFLRPL